MKRAKNISDRGLRYRATANAPAGPRLCGYCGNPKIMGIDHIDGREENSDGRNLIYACKSCNTAKGLAFRKLGRGRLTSQTNPGGYKGGGAKSMEQYVLALLSMKGQSDAFSHGDAVEMLHDTSAAKRSKYAKEIWAKRSGGGRERARQESRREARRVPF